MENVGKMTSAEFLFKSSHNSCKFSIGNATHILKSQKVNVQFSSFKKAMCGREVVSFIGLTL